jgi:hypothetical protein
LIWFLSFGFWFFNRVLSHFFEILQGFSRRQAVPSYQLPVARVIRAPVTRAPVVKSQVGRSSIVVRISGLSALVAKRNTKFETRTTNDGDTPITHHLKRYALCA